MNPISMRFVAEFAELLTTALIHFVWQGAVLSLGLVLIVKLFAARTARHRYLLSVGTLLLMSMAPFLTALLHRNVGSMPGNATDVTSEYSKTVVEDPSSVNVESDPSAAISEPQINGSWDSPSQPVVSASWLNSKIEFYVLLTWLAGVLILSTRLTAAYCMTLWIRRNLTPLAEQFEQRVQSLGRKLGMDARNRVFTCMRVGQAVAVGFVRPIVLIPAAWLTQLTPEMLEAVIAHELAHIRRWDLWVNLAQRVIETLLFYHPAVWWLSNRIRLEREMCCDEIAVQCFDRAMYARSLESVAGLGDGNLLLAASMSGGKKMNLLRRVQYLLGAAPSDTAGNWWAIVFVGMVLTFAMAVAFSLTPGTPSSVVIADDTPDKSDESKVIEKIESLGGNITRDNSLPINPVVEVSFRTSTTVADQNLGLLKDFHSLRSLSIGLSLITETGLKKIRDPYEPKVISVTQGNKITDEGLKEICKLQNLTALDLTNSLITDLGVSELENLKHLSSLSIARNRITDGGLKRIGKLKNLTTLDLERTQATDVGVIELSELKRMTKLKLDFTMITDESLKVINGFKELTTLHLGNTQITDTGLKYLGDLKSLSSLNLDSTPISDSGLKQLREFKNLKSLNLGRTQITGNGLKEAGLQSLTFLALGGSPISDAGMTGLRDLKELASLSLFRTQITDAGLKELSGLKNLTSLDLSNTQITDFGLKELSGLTNLTDLSLGFTSITDDGLKELKSLKNLKTLNLIHSKITDEGLKELKPLKNLTELFLINTKITDVGLKELSECENLTTLYLNRTQITDEGLKQLRSHKNLTKLNLINTKITDDGLNELSEFKNLTILYLGDTQIADKGLQELKSLKNLKVLNLSNTQVTDIGLNELRCLNNLRVLSLIDTKVTQQGVDDLRQSLPHLRFELPNLGFNR